MKFYITERGELSHQLSIAEKTMNNSKPEDALLAISKNINNLNLQNFLLKFQNKIIFHATITGFGGTMIEPGVCDWKESIYNLNQLIEKGFPTKQIVLRIDPIIPTDKGIEVAKQVILACPNEVKRIRFSFIDGYKNISNHLPWNTFHAPIEQQNKALNMLYNNIGDKYLEACGEPQLKENTGCISIRDYDILGLPYPQIIFKKQRKGCLCLNTKTEILKKQKCPNGCKYCYYNLGDK
jgi:DNA repair photolyase